MRLIMTHLVNFLLLSGIWLTQVVIIPDKLKMTSDGIGWTVNFFALYLQLFLIYLVTQFTRNMQQAQVEDKAISKNVPFTVFL